MKQLNGTELKRLHRQWRKQEPAPLVLLLEALSGSYNLGAIIRTAAAYRVDHLHLAAMQLDPTAANVGKTALGTDRYLPWTVHESLDDALAAVRSGGFRLVGLELADEAQPIHDAGLAGPVCLVIGHEDRGLSKSALEACDNVVYLPQLGRVGSLNVATATSIAIWEHRRAGWVAGD